jgi:hypothetical protein
MLNATSREALIDARGRPYFLWDCELTLAEFEERLRDPDPAVQAYFVGKVMRQAKPDDVFRFVSLAKIRALWPALERHLGRERTFWAWVLDTWAER